MQTKNHAYPNINQLVAHRGASAYAPENTASAIIKAAKMGVKWIEVDVNISLEHTPVIFHDADLTRCSNGKGKLVESADQVLEKLDFGSWFSEEFKQEPMLSLNHLIRLALEYDLSLNLEIKPETNNELNTVIAIKNLLNSFADSALPHIVFSSFNHQALLYSMQYLKQHPRALLVDDINQASPELIQKFEACGLHFDGQKSDEISIRKWAKTNLPLLAYTVNDKTLAQSLLSLGVTAVFSDYPDLFNKPD